MKYLDLVSYGIYYVINVCTFVVILYPTVCVSSCASFAVCSYISKLHYTVIVLETFACKHIMK